MNITTIGKPMTTVSFDISIDKEEILEKLQVHDIIDWIDCNSIYEQFVLTEYMLNNIVSELPLNKKVRIAYMMTDVLNKILSEAVTPEVE